MATKITYAKDFFKQNPITTIIGGGLILFIGYRMLRKAVKPGPIIPIPPPITPPPPVPSEPTQKQYTYLAQQYSDFADKLFDAMSGSIWTGEAGTDTKTIANVMKQMKTKADVLALIDAYGRRALTTPYGWDTDPLTLSQSFKYEMEDSEIDSVVNANIRTTGYKF